MAACADLAHLHTHNPLLDAVIQEIDGRRIRIGDRWAIDFASCNYLGPDLDQQVIAQLPAYLERWGTHPGWSRMLGSPVLYQLPTDRNPSHRTARRSRHPAAADPHPHPRSVIPILASDGTIFLDTRAHKTIDDGCTVARAHGATVQHFAHNDPDDLERLLRRHAAAPRPVCMDGINSMTGNPPEFAAFARLARDYDALLYVDGAHGFGVVGERRPDESCPYGQRGNGVVRHLGQTDDHLTLTAGFSKAYSSLLAFVTCPPPLKRLLKVTVPPYLYSGPSPVASLASALVGRQVNEVRGDQLCASLYRKTRQILDHLDELGAATLNTSAFPIIEVPLANPDHLNQVGQFLFDHGIYVTLAFYPGVPRDEVGFRLQVTAANTDDQVDQLLAVLDELAATFPSGPLTLTRPAPSGEYCRERCQMG